MASSSSTPGDIEAEFAQIGTTRVMKEFLTYRNPGPLLFPKGTVKDLDIPSMIRSYCQIGCLRSEDDINYYATKFENKGFTPAIIVIYYRNWDRNWELTAPWTGAQIKVPVKFIVGDQDLVYNNPGGKEYIHEGGCKRYVPVLEEVIVMEGVAHFINQEKADEVKSANTFTSLSPNFDQ